jgi:protein-disulfide isomerase
MQSMSSALVVLLAASLSSAQLPIPPGELGFVYQNGQADARVKVGAYLDFTCPDSQAAFPTLLQVANHYQSSQVQLRVHAFSLPYHRNSHTISKAAYFLSTYKSPKGASVYDWIQAVYNNIDSLATAATVDKTDLDVLNFLASLAYNVTGVPTGEFTAGVLNTDIDQTTRLDWKYGCTRGVYGTPLFTVNDVFVNASPTWAAADWIGLINTVLAEGKMRMRF